MYINILGHMTEWPPCPYMVKKTSKTFLCGTGGPISKKLGMKHRWIKHYNVYINNDPVVTLTYFTTRSA